MNSTTIRKARNTMEAMYRYSWQIIRDILAEHYPNAMHYTKITEAVLRDGRSGVTNLGGKTPTQTIGTILRSKPDLFESRGNGFYRLRHPPVAAREPSPDKKKPQPLDLCLYQIPMPGPLQPNRRSMKWSELISRAEYDGVRDNSNVIYWSVARARCEFPDVVDAAGGLVLIWSHWERIFSVKVVPEGVRYRITTDRLEPIEPRPSGWNAIKDSRKLAEICFHWGRYISGVKESDCFPSPDPHEAGGNLGR